LVLANDPFCFLTSSLRGFQQDTIGVVQVQIIVCRQAGELDVDVRLVLKLESEPAGSISGSERMPFDGRRLCEKAHRTSSRP